MEEIYRDYTILKTLSQRSSKSRHLAKLNIQNPSLPPLFILRHYKKPEEPYEHQIHKELSSTDSNILKLYSSWQDSTGFFMCIEYCENSNLKRYIRKNNPGSNKFPQILQNCMQLSLNLNTMHNLGITHNNISSSKVLITSQNSMKLSDFSSAIYHGNIKLFNCKNLSAPSYSGSFKNKHPEFFPFIQDIKNLGLVFVEIALNRSCYEFKGNLSNKDIQKLEIEFGYFKYDKEFLKLVVEMLTIGEYTRSFLQKIIEDIRKIYSSYNENDVSDDSGLEKFRVDSKNYTLRLIDELSSERNFTDEQAGVSVSSSRIYLDFEEDSLMENERSSLSSKKSKKSDRSSLSSKKSERSSLTSKKSERSSLSSKKSEKSSLSSKKSERSSMTSKKSEKSSMTSKKSEKSLLSSKKRENYTKSEFATDGSSKAAEKLEILLNPNEIKSSNMSSINMNPHSSICFQYSFEYDATNVKKTNVRNNCSKCEIQDDNELLKLPCNHFLHISCIKNEMEQKLLENKDKKMEPFKCYYGNCKKKIGFDYLANIKELDEQAKKISLMQLCANLKFYCNDCRKYSEEIFLLSDKLKRLNLFCEGCKRTHCNFCGARGGHRFFCDLFRDFERGIDKLEKYKKYF